jgi:putative ABC transport system permease protein
VPGGSRVVEGVWWARDYQGPPLVSFDAELARGMGLAVGDTLTVNVLGRDVTAKIANLRTIDWTSLRINYALVFSPASFAGAPETHIATARVPPDRETALETAVTDRFPNISAIPVKDALQAVGQMVASVAVALQVTAAIALVAASLVLAGALAASRRRRLYEAVVLKVLGATRRDLLKAFLLEYGLMGLLAAGIAAALGTLAAYLVLTQVMRTGWVFLPGPVALSAGVALALTLVLGYAGTWRALGAPAVSYLRNE